MSVLKTQSRLMSVVLGLAISGNALAATEIAFWHSMEGELGKEVDSLAQRFNQAHPDYKIVPTYKGNYEQSLAAGIAAVRTGKAPAILQVYEVGTATMMASKAIVPVHQVFQDAGIPFDEKQFVRKLQRLARIAGRQQKQRLRRYRRGAGVQPAGTGAPYPDAGGDEQERRLHLLRP